MSLWNVICLTQGRNEGVVKLLVTLAIQAEVCQVAKYRLIKRPCIPPGSQERTNLTFYVLNQVQLLPHSCSFHILCDSALQGHSHPSEASESIAQSISRRSPSCVSSAVTFMGTLQCPLAACTRFFIQWTRFLNQSYLPSRLIFIKRLCCTSLCQECMWVGVAQSVQRLAASWTVRGSNLFWGENFRSRSDRFYGQLSLLYSVNRLFPGVKRLGPGLIPTQRRG